VLLVESQCLHGDLVNSSWHGVASTCDTYGRAMGYSKYRQQLLDMKQLPCSLFCLPR
jgi:hypothetical protein